MEIVPFRDGDYHFRRDDDGVDCDDRNIGGNEKNKSGNPLRLPETSSVRPLYKLDSVYLIHSLFYATAAVPSRFPWQTDS